MRVNDCTHADAGEARERAHVEFWQAHARAKRESFSPRRRETYDEMHAAHRRLNNFTPCPDCGRWREGER